jgi:hypothetical protein
MTIVAARYTVSIDQMQRQAFRVAREPHPLAPARPAGMCSPLLYACSRHEDTFGVRVMGTA